MKFLKVRDVKSPVRGTDKAAGVDFFIPSDFQTTTIQPQQSILIPSGIKVNIPEGYMFTGFNKSGVATKKTLIVGACVIDEDYLMEMHLHLINVSDKPVTLEAGDKILQFVLVPISYDTMEEVQTEEELINGKETNRTGGFGSTGTK